MNTMNDANGIRQAAPAEQALPSDTTRPLRMEIAVRSDFISFRSDAEQHRIDVLRIRTVSSMDTGVTLWGVPSFSSGCLRLRSARVPVVDLRTRDGASGSSADHGEADILVIECEGPPVAALIDARTDLAGLSPSPELSSWMREAGDHEALTDEDACPPSLLVWMEVLPV